MPKQTLTNRIGRFFISHNYGTLVVILIMTLVLGYFATRVRLKTPTIDLFPKSHPYVKTYVEYEDIFGGANVVALSLEVKQGDVYNTKTLEKLRRITKAVELLPAVNNYSVLSLAQRKVKITTVDEVEGFKSNPVMWPDVPQTREGLDELRRKIRASGRYHGTLVSKDDKALLILAGFFEKGLQSASDTLTTVVTNMALAEGRDPKEGLASLQKMADEETPKIFGKPVWSVNDTLFDAIDKILKVEDDENHVTRMIGRPILLGWIAKNFPRLVYIFILTIVAIIACLTIYFRETFGVLIPTMTALLSAVWGLGFLGFMNYLESKGFHPFGLNGYYFNPLVIVVPFIISARALSHSVQLIERYTEEFDRFKDKKEAAVVTFEGLFKPAVLSIVLDAISVFIVAITPIPLMQKLALMGGFWILSIIGTNVIFNPVLLTVLPPMHKTVKTGKEGMIDRLLRAIIRSTTQRHQKAILVGTLLIFVLGLVFARNLVIGDVNPGTPMLWPGSQYNKDTSAMGDRFGKTEMFSIVLHGDERDRIKDPQVLLSVEKLQREFEAMKEVSSTSSVAELVPDIVKIMHSSHPKWELIPENIRDSGFYLGLIFSGAEPGDLDRFLDRKMQDANIMLYLRDHKGTTLRTVIAKARDFIAANKLLLKPTLALDPAGGSVHAAALGEDQKLLATGDFAYDPANAAALAENVNKLLQANKSTVIVLGKSADAKNLKAKLDAMLEKGEIGDPNETVKIVLVDSAALSGAAKDKAYLAANEGMKPEYRTAFLDAWAGQDQTAGAKYLLAGNMGGLLAAVNETIVMSEAKVTFLAFFVVFIVCVISYRSFWAGIYFLIPTAISNYLTYALMGAFKIGLDVNSLPVVALGVGLGVDYGLYVIGRIEEEYVLSGDLQKATGEAIMTAGRAVFFTAATMVAGIIFWAFSFLRFQAEMGILLAFWMIVSMLGGLILLPTLVVTFKPKFVTRRYDALKNEAA